jgi:hypothetical protein
MGEKQKRIGLGKSVRYRNSTCPHCQRLLNGGFAITRASGQGAVYPDKGTYNLCSYCGEWSVFEAEGALRVPTVDEYIEIGRSEEATLTRATWQKRLEPTIADRLKGNDPIGHLLRKKPEKPKHVLEMTTQLQKRKFPA